jgi:hypothetical protein
MIGVRAIRLGELIDIVLSFAEPQATRPHLSIARLHSGREATHAGQGTRWMFLSQLLHVSSRVTGSYDDRAEFGGKSWDWNGCEEYFDKPANYHDDSRVYSPKLAKVGRKGHLDVAISDMVPELRSFVRLYQKPGLRKGRNSPRTYTKVTSMVWSSA